MQPVVTLGANTPAGLCSISLTFNGGGAGASVQSNAIILVTQSEVLKSQRDVAVAADQVCEPRHCVSFHAKVPHAFAR